MLKKRTKWRSLENTAKIFPATSGKKDERVFRFSCELKEMVRQEVLQKALELTVQEFPLFLCVLRKGMFWNYLEETDIKPRVFQEYKPPCSQLYVRDQKNLLFEVTYYQYRINFETYHALTDGTGALQFLKVLVYHYLRIAHPEQVTGSMNLVRQDATWSEMEEDSFLKYYNPPKGTSDIPKYKACQLKFHKTEYGQLKLIEGVLSVRKALEISRKYHTTLTVYLTAVYLKAISEVLTPRQRKKPVSLMIPVNLRNYFPSESARNFFGWIDVGYDFSSQSNELSDIIQYTSDFFKKELSRERMERRMGGLMRLERNPLIRILPLQLKLMFMQLGAWFSTSEDTAIFSNIGKIDMPEDAVPYIRMFDIYTTTPKIELCMCSFQDKLVLSFTSAFENSHVERNFFRILSSNGLSVEISARLGKENEVR